MKFNRCSGFMCLKSLIICWLLAHLSLFVSGIFLYGGGEREAIVEKKWATYSEQLATVCIQLTALP